MSLVSWPGAVGITVSVLVTAALLNRFAPKKRPHIRRLVFLCVLYLLGYALTLGLPYLGQVGAAETARVVAELLGEFSLINVGAVLLFEVALPRIGVDPAT